MLQILSFHFPDLPDKADFQCEQFALHYVILHAVSSFRLLQNLSIHGRVITRGVFEETGVFPPNIQTVVLHVVEGAGVLFQYLRSDPAHRPPRYISLHAQHVNTDVELYFQDFGSAVETLKIGAFSECLPFVISGIQMATNLKYLYVEGDTPPLLQILEAVSSHSLQTIHIYESHFGEDTSEIVHPWAVLDSKLAQPQFRFLTALQLQASSYLTQSGEIRDWDFTGSPLVRAAMPLTTVRGIMVDPLRKR
ncbi:hypothetical protein B0H11DRAFT_2113352 [Mycena galericulata]|nr:hypothetical protein B0H11DRAFT_2113352 [Mycena galericulata]